MSAESQHHTIILDESAARIVQRSLASYEKKPQNTSEEEWLTQFLNTELPENPPSQNEDDAKAMIALKSVFEDKSKSLKKSTSQGQDKISWFTEDILNGCKAKSDAEMKVLLDTVDTAICDANKNLYDTIVRSDGKVNQNPHLNGFIAEAEHVNTFNMEGALQNNSDVKAYVLSPDSGEKYSKNSVDVVIKENGKTVKRYQAKYGGDSKKTERLFEKGDYKGQRKLIPEGQQIKAKHTTKIEHDGIESKPLSKEKAKAIQDQAQEDGIIKNHGWDDFSLRQLAGGIGKRAALSGVWGAGMDALSYTSSQLWNGEEIGGQELVKRAITGGAKTGATTALSGAIKVVLEKQRPIFPQYPPTVFPPVPAPVPRVPINLTSVALAGTAVTSLKTFYNLAIGEISLPEAVDQLEENALSTASGIIAAEKGALLGAALGTTFGPLGAVAGGFIGGVLGGIAGSKLGQALAKGTRIMREVVTSSVKDIGSAIGDTARYMADKVKDALDYLFG